MNSPSETVDALFDGRLTLYQSHAGYRFSLDALLLADFATIRSGDRVVDLGTGNGVVPLALADLHRTIRVTGVELQKSLLDRARRNVAVNQLESRVEIVAGDVRRWNKIGVAASFDAAVCNPPYRKAGSGRLNPDTERQLARHELHGDLKDFLNAGSFLLRAKGRMAIVYPALRAVDLLAAMRHAGIEPKRLRLVHSFPAAPAALLLAEGVKGGRGGLEVLAPLTIYREGKEYTEEVAALIAGRRD
jgi:tRNA1Val (adenine37-N6)-methyltransferase